MATPVSTGNFSSSQGDHGYYLGAEEYWELRQARREFGEFLDQLKEQVEAQDGVHGNAQQIFCIEFRLGYLRAIMERFGE